jgi:hypothetical protein
MASLDRSRDVIELGKRLVAQLSLSDDMTAQWMAHFVAERMASVENATSDARASAEEACARAIFDLWNHRDRLPERFRPFSKLVPILETIASLDVHKGPQFRYFPSRLIDEESMGSAQQESTLLRAALDLDYSARVLIQYFLGAAAGEAVAQAIPWIEAAIKANADVVLEERVVRFVSMSEEPPNDDEIAREAILEKAKKMEAFAQLASAVATDLRKRGESTEAA